ncbi:MAG: preprotein translocase subunit SecG [Myxococcota bacterium]
MDLFIEIVYVFVTFVLILVVLLQAGKGGGLGTALGGGASQGVFGGGGGADFLAKLTQGLAAAFMLCAVYLAYASAHTGSDRLKDASDDTKKEVFGEDEEIDYERIGEGTPLNLPEAGTKAKDVEAAAPAPALTPSIEVKPAEETDAEAPAPAEGAAPAGSETAPADDAAPADEAAPTDDAKPAGDAKPEAKVPATDAEAPTAEPEPTTVDGDKGA